jgi:hypothetical protein
MEEFKGYKKVILSENTDDSIEQKEIQKIKFDDLNSFIMEKFQDHLKSDIESYLTENNYKFSDEEVEGIKEKMIDIYLEERKNKNVPLPKELNRFVKIIEKFKSFDEAFEKIKSIKDVPFETSMKFQEWIQKTTDKPPIAPKEVFKILYNYVKNNK